VNCDINGWYLAGSLSGDTAQEIPCHYLSGTNNTASAIIIPSAFLLVIDIKFLLPFLKSYIPI
jgi:hypothetical protein